MIRMAIVKSEPRAHRRQPIEEATREVQHRVVEAKPEREPGMIAPRFAKLAHVERRDDHTLLGVRGVDLARRHRADLEGPPALHIELELHVDHDAVRDLGEHLGEQRNRLDGLVVLDDLIAVLIDAAAHVATQPNFRELVPCQVADRARIAGQAVQVRIVKHDRVTVARQANVELDRGNAELDSAAKSRERVFLVQPRYPAMPDHERLLLRCEEGIRHLLQLGIFTSR